MVSKRFKIAYSVVSVTLIAASVFWNMKNVSREYTEIVETEEGIEIVEEKIDPWDLFVEAVIWRESRGDVNAIGDSGRAVGVLQIHPIMVREANRIVAMNGGEKDLYSYEDRYDRDKSIEMFKIVQDYHNKEHDMRKALDIWNHNHPDSYRNEIMNKYNDYLNGEETTKNVVTGRI